jgi:hypothetical protein
LDDGSNSNLWTVDFWVRFNGDPLAGTVGFISQYVDANGYWWIGLSGNALYVQIRTGGTTTVSVAGAWNPATATWYHIAVVKDGTNGYMLFVAGSQVGSTTADTDVMPNYAGSLYVGGLGTGSLFTGWIDELRISKGIARWTSNFTPPIAEYAPAAAGNNGMFFTFI